MRYLKKIPRATFVFFINQVIVRALSCAHLNIFWGNLLLTINKTAGFLEDPKFQSCLHAIEGSHRYDAYQARDSIAWRLHTLVWAAQSAMPLTGDFVECGVFKGDFSWVLSEMTDFARRPKTFYLYDSFSGFSERYSSPDDFPDVPEFYAHANQLYKDPEIYPAVQKRFEHLRNVKVIKGFVPEILHQIVPDQIAFLHIDLNSPAAEVAALEVLFPKVAAGGYIIFDDYGWIAARKQKDAIDGFFTPLGYVVLELPTGQGLVIKR